MARSRNCLDRWWTVAVIWTSVALLIFLGIRIALDNSRYTLTTPGSSMSTYDRRAILYDKMARDLDEHGVAFLRGGETSQALSLSDIFELRDGTVTPILKAANPPVRANVLYMSSEYSVPISQVCFWGVGRQVISGTDPLVIRMKLKDALPRAPEKQLYDPVMLHTSFARILGHPSMQSEDAQITSQLKFFHELVASVNKKLHGFQATMSELWFVEEFDVLALALNGRMKTCRFHLNCSRNLKH